MDDRVGNARRSARELVEVARNGETFGVFEAFQRITSGERDAHEIVSQLVSATAQMMLARVGDACGPDAIYAVDLRDDEQSPVPIDEVAPPLRATVRALLAELNGHSDEARFQIELALGDPDVSATLDVLVHSLLWTVGMLEWCVDADVEAPEWLAVGTP